MSCFFDARITPSVISQWMFGPGMREETIIHLEVDARKGGRFSFAVERNGETIDHIGEYLVFERPQQLAFTWGILTLTHTLDEAWKDYLDRTKNAWGNMLDKLKEVKQW